MPPTVTNPTEQGGLGQPDHPEPLVMVEAALRRERESARRVAATSDTQSDQLPPPFPLHTPDPTPAVQIGLDRRLVENARRLRAEMRAIMVHTRECIARSQALLARPIPELSAHEPDERAG